MNVFIIAALTADGYIGKDDAHKSTRWTSAEDAAWFVEKSTEAGVVVMGRNTYETMSRPLPNRVNIVYTHDLAADQQELKSGLSLEAGKTYYTDQPPAVVLAILEEAGFSAVAISGGSSIYTLFMQAGLVDTLYLTIEPVIFGQGVKLFTQPLHQQLQLRKIISLSDQTILLEYQVVR